MNKKGFTLIEILAVITILGILGLVTIPIISKSVEKSKIKAYRETINSIIESTKIYRANNDYEAVTNELIDVTGALIEYEHKDQILSGSIKYENGIYIIMDIKNAQYCAAGTSEAFEVYEGECEDLTDIY